MNLAGLLTASAERDPDHVAFKLDDAELTYGALDGASAHIAGLLAEHGFQRGDRVGIMLPNVPYFPVCYYGVLRAGGIVVPTNVLLKKREVAYYLSDSGAELLFAWHDFAQDAKAGAEQAGARRLLVEPGTFEQQVGAATPDTSLANTADDDTAVLLYTSGTTGQPKGAELIIRGGYNVYPREIEEVLYEHPAVREAAVLGVPHDEYGEEVGAAVALKDGVSATPEELRDYVRGQVAAYKYPRVVWLVDELPKGPTGKRLKREISAPEQS